MEKIILNDITLQDQPEKTSAVGEFGNDQVGPGKRISMHFELSLVEGDIIDSNFNTQPVEFSIGDGNLLPAFEQSIYGLYIDDENTVLISAERAFGVHNADNVQVFPMSRFPADLVMERGLMLNFADSAGNEQPGVISEYDERQVKVDFNHPLAGRDIVFRVKIVAITTEHQD